MFNRSLGVVAALLMAGSAYGNAVVIGKTAKVQGLVTVSTGTQVGMVAADHPIVEGSRYVTSSSGSVTLRLDNDCDVTLRPNQSLTVDRSRNCAELWAAVQTLGGQPGAVVVAGGNPLLGFGTVIGVALLAADGRGPRPPTGGDSGNGGNGGNGGNNGGGPGVPGGGGGGLPNFPISGQ